MVDVCQKCGSTEGEVLRGAVRSVHVGCGGTVVTQGGSDDLRHDIDTLRNARQVACEHGKEKLARRITRLMVRLQKDRRQAEARERGWT